MDAPIVQYGEMEQKMCFKFSVSFLKANYIYYEIICSA